MLKVEQDYENRRNSNCFDVNKGKYIEFKGYEDYRDFILKSREIKNGRFEKSKKEK